MSHEGRSTGVGIDVGGTFTDVILIDDNRRHVEKVPTTSPPDDGVMTGIVNVCERAGIQPSDIDVFRHGTTVATNALLTRGGARTALVTTEGFRDVLEIGRQDRPALYDLEVDRPPPLVPRCHRFEVTERTPPPANSVARGERITPDPAELERLLTTLADGEIESIAVSLLHAYHDETHEATIASAIRDELDVPVITSNDVLPEFREYERTATTAASAYLTPVIDAYLDRLEVRCTSLELTEPELMQSNGGIATPQQVRQRAVATILSGPAAGAVGATTTLQGDSLSDRAVISLDMGGTSADVCLIDGGRPDRTTETTIGGVPIRIPTIDITTVGAGGGSIAWVDEGGALRVGPASAGAEPGPACYGRGGDETTVTDAAVVLGIIGDETDLGGTIEIDKSLATDVLEDIAWAGDLGGPIEAARGIYRVATATMTRAIRSITVERGRDPRGMVLVAFGGAGGIYATALADQLDIDHVVIPGDGGVLSADGLLRADEVHDVVRSHPVQLDSEIDDHLASVFASLEEEALERCSMVEAARLETELDLRYVGQSFELTVPVERPLDAEMIRDVFHREHERKRGYRLTGEIEVVSCRVRATVPSEYPASSSYLTGIERTGSREVHTPGQTERQSYAVYRGRPTTIEQLTWPCIIDRDESTVLVPPGWSIETIIDGVLTLRREASND